MSEAKESWWSKHLTGTIQCVLSLYCAILATVEYFYPRSSPVQKISAGSASAAGGAMSQSTYKMPVYLWIGVVGLALSVAIPAIVRMIKRWTHRSDKLPIEGLLTPLQIETLRLAKELNDLLQANPFPKRTDYGYNRNRESWDAGADRRHAFQEARNSVEQKVRAKYAMSFQAKTIDLYHRLVTEADADDYNLETIARGEGRPEDIANLVAGLRKAVFTLEDA